MKEKKGGCGCGSKKVTVKQPIKKVLKPINKIYKTGTNIFN